MSRTVNQRWSDSLMTQANEVMRSYPPKDVSPVKRLLRLPEMDGWIIVCQGWVDWAILGKDPRAPGPWQPYTPLIPYKDSALSCITLFRRSGELVSFCREFLEGGSLPDPDVKFYEKIIAEYE